MTARADWKKSLKADPTDWLLEPEDPGVRYLALRDIADGDEKDVREARRTAHRDGPIARILAEMAPDGYWIAPGNVYANKCRGTVWSIISLAELGAAIGEDARVGAACAYLTDQALLKGGQFSPGGKPTNMGLCLQGNMLLSLMDLGYPYGKLAAAYEWTARAVTGEDQPTKVHPDGLPLAEGATGPFVRLRQRRPDFVCRTNEFLPCGWAGAKVMMAFSRLPAERRTAAVRRAIQTGVDFFLSGDLAEADFPGHRLGTPDPRWWQFRFPSFWGADLLQIAEAFTGLGYGADHRLAGTLDLIRQKQDERGRWPLEFVDASHKMWVKYGTRGQPSKWVTLRALRVLKKTVRGGLEP
jgi:hypothetical protein